MKIFFFSITFILFVGCGGGSSSSIPITTLSDSKVFDANVLPLSEGDWYKPSVDSSWQLQLNSTLNKSYIVDIYNIDLFEADISSIESLKDDGKKVICSFSAGSYEVSRDDSDDFSDEVIGNSIDSDSDEKWLDISNETLVPIMRARLDLAVQKGCDGVEVDNVDGYENDTGFDLDADDQLAYNKFIANEARQRGLSVGLKNDINQVVELLTYYDFAINEGCNENDECDKLKPFIDASKPVFNVEYNSKYIINNEIDTVLCTKMNDMKFQTLVLPTNLDDSFRYSCNTKDNIFNGFGVGFGGGSSFKFKSVNDDAIWVSAVDLMLDDDIANNNYYQDINDFNASAFSNLQNYLTNAKYFTMWVTKGWEEFWYDIDKINEAIKNNKIPVFVYWYFGDTLVDALPTQTQIQEYQDDNKKFKEFLDKIDGMKFVIVEPEFNKQIVIDNPQEFTDMLNDTLDTLKDDTTMLSLCMMDTGNRGVTQTYEKCGYENCALGDKYEWGLSKPIYDALLPKLDFISFEEMLGQFSRDPLNPGSWDEPNPIKYTDDELGIYQFSSRLENMATYLYELYKKPIFLPYMAVATATWDDKNDDGVIDDDEVDKSGFETQANQIYKDINKTTLQQKHLFGYSVMELFDEANHDKDGYQFFMNNEYHLGIIKSSAVDGVDDAINGDIEFKKDILDSIYLAD